MDFIHSHVTTMMNKTTYYNDTRKYRHTACCVNGQNMYSIGENSTKELWHGCCYYIHAEMDALNKFCNIRKIYNIKKVSILVIRVGNDGLLKNSRPCSKCLWFMKYQSERQGIKIKNIYYSLTDGTINVVKYSDLVNDHDYHVSRRFRNTKIF